MQLLKDAIQTGESRYAPQYNLSQTEIINQQKMAFLVGAVAFGLPTATIFVGLFLSTCFYYSISHFYYAQFWGSVFIGCLFFIGTYLLAWQGQSRGERLLANFAGPFAWGVALFPTSGPGCTLPQWEGRVFADVTRAPDGTIALLVPANTDSYFTLLPWSATLHGISAAIMFSALAYFALVVFTREEDGSKSKTPSPQKATRNKIYRICGWIIVAMILALGGRLLIEWLTGAPLLWWDANNLTLWCEAIALYAFGITWMVKGRFWGKALVDNPAPA